MFLAGKNGAAAAAAGRLKTPRKMTVLHRNHRFLQNNMSPAPASTIPLRRTFASGSQAKSASIFSSRRWRLGLALTAAATTATVAVSLVSKDDDDAGVVRMEEMAMSSPEPQPVSRSSDEDCRDDADPGQATQEFISSLVAALGEENVTTDQSE